MLNFNICQGSCRVIFAPNLQPYLMKYLFTAVCKTCCAISLVWLITGTSAVFAQSTDASITGTVKGSGGETLPGANVLVKNESTGFQTGTVTNADGRYLLKQLPLGRPYTVTVSYVGYDEQTRTGYALNQGDQLKVDVNLAEAATELRQVEVTGDALTNRIDRLGATTAITASSITKLPVNGRDFNSLSALSPLTNGGNIGSQRFSSTGYFLDGVSARNNLTSGDLGSGPYTVSLEAVREFEVVANEYDVTQGRQGGGAISVVTKSGTNTWTGSAFTYYNSGALASPYNIDGSDREVDFERFQYGFSLGGPIIKDKMHFFVALDRQNETEPFFIADINDATRDRDELANNIRKDTLDKFISVAGRLYGLDTTAQQIGEFERKTVANTFFARIDWQLHPKHRLTLRNNYSDWDNPNSNNDNSAIELFEVWGDFFSRENSTLLSLRSQFSSKLVNELKVQYQTSRREYNPNTLLPFENIPRAIVSVASPFPTGENPNATRSVDVQIGGQRFTPERNLERQFQLVNTTYLTTGIFNWTFGTDNSLTYLDTYISNEQNGRFIFNSFQDFQNLNPTRYAREVPLQGVPSVQQYVLNTSLFGQVQFNPRPNLELQAGLRWDLTSYLTAGDYNPVVDRELGLRTDANPTDWNNIQPRVQMTWDVKGDQRHIVRAGAGIFSPYVINYAQVNNIQNSGTKVAAVDVTRPNDPTQPNLVPRPDFPAYRNDPSTAPGIPAGAPSVSTINLNDPDFQVPTVYKANVTYNRLFGDKFRLGVNLLYSYTTNNYVYVDRNLVDEPYFTLANEGGRGVFVPAESISSRGVTNNVLGRKTQAVGRTLEFTNGANLRVATMVIDGEVILPKNGYINFSYTLNDARDNTSYNGNVANTSTFRPVKSDPRSLSEINYSDAHFRHKVVVYGATPELAGFVLSAAFSGIGGTRYSLVVDSDINGDFVGGPGTDNDLAYVFDPNNPETPAAIRTAINDILADPETRESVKDYIRDSFGQIADRNGGSNPFAGTVDVRLSKVFKTFKTQKLELSVDVFNFANLLNTDWGGNYNLGNRSFSRASSFDQATQQYGYAVQGGVGSLRKGGTPYRIQLGVRYSF